MNQADELAKLQRLHDAGSLTDDEFAQAKAHLLEGRRDRDDARGFDDGHATTSLEGQSRLWGMILHFSQFGGHLIPGAGWVAPIVIWQLKKDELPDLDAHGKNVANWLISFFIYAAVCVPLCFVFVGIPLLIILGVLCVVFAVIGGLKANNGEVWRYPLSITFFK